MSAVDDRMREQLTEMKRMREEAREDNDGLNGGGGGGTSGGVENRVTRLEVQMETVQRDLAEIKADLRSTLDIVRSLPTKSDLSTFRWQWVATAVAAIALIVGGIIGGLGWIKPDEPAPASAAPIIFQVPTAQPAAVPTAHRAP